MNGGEIPQPRKHRSCSVIPSSREQLMSSTASLYTTPCAARFQPTCTYSPAHHGAGTGIWGLAFTYKFILHTPGERKIFEWHSQIPPFLKSFFKGCGGSIPCFQKEEITHLTTFHLKHYPPGTPNSQKVTSISRFLINTTSLSIQSQGQGTRINRYIPFLKYTQNTYSV